MISAAKINTNEMIIFPFSANVYIHKIPDNISVVEGEKLQLHCKVYGSEPISIEWRIGEFNGSKKKKKKLIEINTFTFLRRRYGRI